MKRKFEALPPLSSECCIYRVPERLRIVKENAYTPQVVSIGPLHHGKDGLKAMEEHKIRYLWDYIQRTNVSLEDYINIVRYNESKLRSCYAETIGFSSDEFIEIILVDSAFIIEVLLRKHIKEFREEHDRIFKKPWMLNDVWPDLYLLENQLPFFILKELFDPNKIEFPPKYSKEFSIIKLSHKFFTSTMYLEVTEENLKKMSSTTIQHFVDFLRHLYVPVSPREGGECQSLTTPSMTELDQAGVILEVRQSKNLLDIHFDNGILEIPKLEINSDTDLIIRNLVAFEQCHYSNNYISDYVAIMDRFVNTPKDVELLVKRGIIKNMLGDYNEVCTLINKLANGVTIDSDNFYFADIFKKLNNYNEVPWHIWRANFMQNYAMAAILIIILTVIQAICSMISVI